MPLARQTEKTDAALEENTLRWRKRALMIWALIGICVLVYVFGFILNVLSTPVAMLVWCLVIVFCLRPIVDALHERGVGRAMGTLVAYLVLFAVLFLLGWLLFAPGIGASAQFTVLSDNLPTYVQGVSAWWAEFSRQYADILQNETVQSWITSATDSIYNMVGNFANAAGTGIVEVGTFVGNFAFTIGFALVISFWILMELPGIDREVRRVVNPRHLDDFELFADTMGSVIGGYIKATLLQCFIIGLGCGIGYAILGLPSAAALGIITGILNIIPVVGPWLGGAMAAGVGLVTSPLAALVALIIAVVIQQVVYTFVSPLLMSDSVDIHPILVILGLVCGSAIGGAMAGISGSILGMLASIPIIAAAKAMFVFYYERNTGRRIVAPDGVFFKGAVVDDDTGAGFNAALDAAAPTPQRPFNPLDKNLHPERHHTDDQKEAIRRRLERRKKRLERLRNEDAG